MVHDAPLQLTAVRVTPLWTNGVGARYLTTQVLGEPSLIEPLDAAAGVPVAAEVAA